MGNNQKELKDKIEDIKTDLKEKTKELTEEIKETTEEILNDVKDSSEKFSKKDIEENKAIAALSYLIPPVPYFLENKSKWVRYHAIQGMNLFIIFIILSLTVSVINSLLLFSFPFLKTLLRTSLNVFIMIFVIIGIVNVCNCKAKELPLIKKFKLIKK
jgi:uncharacterized membrane protein